MQQFIVAFTEGLATNKKFIPHMSVEELSALKAKAEAEPGQWVVHKSTALEPLPPLQATFDYGCRFLSMKEYQKYLVRICVCLRSGRSACHCHMLVTC